MLPDIACHVWQPGAAHLLPIQDLPGEGTVRKSWTHAMDAHWLKSRIVCATCCPSVPFRE